MTLIYSKLVNDKINRVLLLCEREEREVNPAFRLQLCDDQMSADINVMKTVFSINSTSVCVCVSHHCSGWYLRRLPQNPAGALWRGRLNLPHLCSSHITSVKNHETSLITRVKLWWLMSVSVVTVPKLLPLLSQTKWPMTSQPSKPVFCSHVRSPCPVRTMSFFFFFYSHM